MIFLLISYFINFLGFAYLLLTKIIKVSFFLIKVAHIYYDIISVNFHSYLI